MTCEDNELVLVTNPELIGEIESTCHCEWDKEREEREGKRAGKPIEKF